MRHDDFKLMRVSDYARVAHLHEGTVRRLAREEKLPAVRVGSQWRILTVGGAIPFTSRGPRPVTGRLR